MADLPQINFTRLRLSGSPASSPRIVDAPSSPTRSVYLDMEETTPISPQAPPAFAYRGNKNDTPTTPTTISAAQPNGSSATVRRTNFFDDDSSDDEDVGGGGAIVRLNGGAGGAYSGGTGFLNATGRSILPGGYPSTTDEDDDGREDDVLTTADEQAFSTRHSLLNDDYDDPDRGRTPTRSPSSTGATHSRKGAYYLGVRPEEYAFVCGTRPASSVRDDDYREGMETVDPLQLGLGSGGGGGGGGGGKGVYESPHATLLSECMSPRHVPFGPPDIAVAARRVQEEQQQQQQQQQQRGMLRVPRYRASSSVFPSASEYEGDGDTSTVDNWGRGGGVKERSVSYGGAGILKAEGKPGVAASKVPDVFEEKNDGAAAETQSLQSKTDGNILGVHAITLQALLRDEEGLQASASSVRRKSVSSEYSRKEFLKSKMTQQPGDSATSLPPPVPDIPPMAQIQLPKRVSVVPPPIDTSRPSRSKGEAKIRTPYPFNHHKSFPKTLGSPGLPPPRAKDAVLTLSIRRRRNVLSSHVARVTLPAELMESNSAGRLDDDDVAPDEQSPPAFDDAAFFKQLRVEYAHLAGRWWRFFSARSLRLITVGHTTAWSTTESCLGPAACGGGRCCPAARAAHGAGLQQQQQQRGCSAATPSGIYHVRSPRFLASQGLQDTFSEENLLAHFRKPRLGRNRFAWVLWAGRLAGLHEQPDLFGDGGRPYQRQSYVDWRDRELPPTPGGGRVGDAAAGRTPSTASTALAGWSEDDGKNDAFVSAAELGMAGGIGPGHSIATLEFVEDWSRARILAAVLVVLLLAAAGIVLWILFGTGAVVEGFRGSGARVGTAVLIGGGVLMLGWTLVLAWMGFSWCVV